MKHTQHILTLCVLLLGSIFLWQNAAFAGSCCDVPGDANDDGSVNVGDGVYLINYVFKGGAAPPCLDEGDANADGALNVGDGVYIINYVFKGGPAPICLATDVVVFDDEYGDGVTYEAFAGSKLDAVQISADSLYAGTQGLVITIPDVGDPSGSYSGGAFTDSVECDLTGYNAVTFWAKASKEATLDVAGLGNDNTGTSLYTAEVNGLTLTTAWQKYIIPIPLAEKLDAERGLFFFAEGPEGGLGYDIWIDEIVYESLTTIINPRPALTPTTIEADSGDVIALANATVTFEVDGSDITINAMPGYFTFISSDPSVVSVGVDGVIRAEGQGSATLTAELGGIAATGSITVNVSGAEAVPTNPAPTPSQDPGDVVSIYTSVYTNVTSVTWSTVWDNTGQEEFVIGTDTTQKYFNLVFAGIEFNPVVDASAMTHFRVDVWTPEDVAGKVFKIKLVDFGPNGVFDGGGDDSEHELTFTDATMASQTWVSIDVPLASFTGLTNTTSIAQMILSGDFGTVYIDNLYFYDSGVPSEPLVAAPTPTPDPAYVVSLYSDAYTSVSVDTWSAPWDQADVSDFVIGSDNMKKYTNLIFAGVEFINDQIDATSMEYFHMDVWTPIPTDAPAVFKVKLVDFGADGVSGGTDDVEHELTFDENTMNTGSWVSIDVPLSDLTGLTTRANLAQLIISGDLGTIFVDNIYFYSPPPTEPQSSAPTPTPDPGDVVSLYSDAYTSATIDTWSAGWDQADVADFTIGSDNLKQYTNLVFAGIEFTTTTVDATGMTHFHMDVWTPDPTTAPAAFKVKLVDFGADGAYQGGDDTEHELTFNETTMNTGSWVSIDVPLSNFVGLTTQAHLAQMIISGDPNTVFVDNIYFYDANTPTEPTTSAPTPSHAPADVFSVFSDAYTGVDFDTWSSPWDDVTLSEFVLGSDTMIHYTSLVFSIAEYTSGTQDISGMTHVHIDIWTPDATDVTSEFKIKLVDYGANGIWDGGGDDTEHELTYTQSTMSTGTWVSLDIPLDDFVNLTGREHFAQLILSGTYGNIFVDNFYFHK